MPGTAPGGSHQDLPGKIFLEFFFLEFFTLGRSGSAARHSIMGSRGGHKGRLPGKFQVTALVSPPLYLESVHFTWNLPGISYIPGRFLVIKIIAWYNDQSLGMIE